jgi:hypothetical protein
MSGSDPLGREGWAPVVAAVVALLIAGLMALEPRDFALDDAWIHLAYARSLSLGEGLSYNPGDWETGFSSPLYVLVLAMWPIPAHPGDPVVSVLALGALLHAITAALAGWLALRLGRERASVEHPLPLWSITLLAGVLVATTPTVVQGAVSGMEVALASAVLLGCIACAVVGSSAPAAALGVLAVLARPEALPFLLVFGSMAWLWRRRNGEPAPRRRAPLWAAVGACFGLATWVIHTLTVSGHLWPNTQYVKGRGGGLSGLTYLTQEVLPWQPWIVGLTGVVLVALGLRRDAAERRCELACIVAAAAATWLAIALTRPLHPGVQFYESRYFTPFAPLFVLVLPFGLRGLGRWVGTALVLPVAVLTGLQLDQVRAIGRGHAEDTRALHTTVARWVATNLPPDAVVAAEGAGALRYWTPRTMTIVDLVGLNDREAAHLHHDRIAKLCHFVRRTPTHMVIPADWVPLFAGTFMLEPLEKFHHDVYTQVLPPRPMRVVVFEITGVHPTWAEGCSAS